MNSFPRGIYLVLLVLIFTYQASYSSEIWVKSSQEFLSSLGSNKTIILLPGDYSFSKIKTQKSDFYEIDINGVLIKNLENVEIRGAYIMDAPIVILSDDFNSGLRIENCRNILLENITFKQKNHVNSFAQIWILNSEKIELKKIDFKEIGDDLRAKNCIKFSDSKYIELSQCIFKKLSPKVLLSNSNSKEIFMKNSIFSEIESYVLTENSDDIDSVFIIESDNKFTLNSFMYVPKKEWSDVKSKRYVLNTYDPFIYKHKRLSEVQFSVKVGDVIKNPVNTKKEVKKENTHDFVYEIKDGFIYGGFLSFFPKPKNQNFYNYIKSIVAKPVPLKIKHNYINGSVEPFIKYVFIFEEVHFHQMWTILKLTGLINSFYTLPEPERNEKIVLRHPSNESEKDELLLEFNRSDEIVKLTKFVIDNDKKNENFKLIREDKKQWVLYINKYL